MRGSPCRHIVSAVVCVNFRMTCFEVSQPVSVCVNLFFHYRYGNIAYDVIYVQHNKKVDLSLFLMLKGGTRRGTRTRRTQILSLLRMPFRQPGK